MQGFLFLHIPKTGGKTVEQYFFGTPQVDAHRRALGLLPRLDDFKDWYVFAFIRNPFDRLVSVYKYYRGGGNRSPADKAIGEWMNKLTFSEFVSKLPSRLEGCPYFGQIETMILPQTSYVKEGVNLHSFENLEEEIHTIARRIGFPVREVPHLNASSGPEILVSGQNKSAIASLYSEDLALSRSLTS